MRPSDARWSQVVALRDRTNCDLLDCRKALDLCGYDDERAMEWLRGHSTRMAARADPYRKQGLTDEILNKRAD